MGDIFGRSRLHEMLGINSNKQIPKKLLEYIVRAGGHTTLGNPTFEGKEIIETSPEMLRCAWEELKTRPPKRKYKPRRKL